MKQSTAHTLLQKSFTMVMAAMVFMLAAFVPINRELDQTLRTQEQSLLSDASFSSLPDFAPVPEPLPKLQVLFFALPALIAMLVALTAPEIQSYRAVFQQFFISKINFVFVSTLAP